MKTTLAILLVLTASSIMGQEAARKTPVPADVAQAEATKLIKEVYGDEWTKAKTSAEKQALAKKLLGKANESKDDPASKFVLLKLARDIATQAGDGQMAFHAVDAMAGTFQVDALEMKSAVLTTFASAAKMSAQHKAIAEEALKLLGGAISQDNFTLADQLGNLALDEAQKAREKELVTQAQERVAEVADFTKEYEAAKVARATLEKTPDDPEANLAVGKYQCFVKGDWDRGLPMLALAKDEVLKALAQQELQGAASSAEQAKLGDGWWSVAEKEEGTTKKQIQRRAGYWYRKASPGLSGIMKDKVEKRLATMEPSPQRPDNDWLDVLTAIDPKRDALRGEWKNVNKAIETTGRMIPYIMLPVTIEGEYDLAVEFTRLSGNGSVFFVLPVATSQCEFILSAVKGKYSGLTLIDGMAIGQNRTTKQPGTISNGQKHSLLVSVRLKDREASITVVLDGVRYVGWTGNQSSLSSPTKLPNPKCPAIGTGQDPAVFQSIRVRTVSGQVSFMKATQIQQPGHQMAAKKPVKKVAAKKVAKRP